LPTKMAPLLVVAALVAVYGDEISATSRWEPSADLVRPLEEPQRFEDLMKKSSDLGEANPLLFGKHAKFTTANGAKPQLAETITSPKKDMRSNPINPDTASSDANELKELQRQVEELREEVKQHKRALANSVVFEAKAATVTKSMQKKKEETALSKVKLEGQRKIEAERTKFRNTLQDKKAKLHAKAAEEHHRVKGEEGELQGLKKRKFDLKVKLQRARREADSRESSDKELLATLQSDITKVHDDLSKLDEAQHDKAVKLHTLEEAKGRLARKEATDITDARLAVEADKSTAASEARVQQELVSEHTAALQLKNQSQVSRLELSQLKGQTAGAVEVAAGAAAALKNVNLLRSTLDEQQEKLSTAEVNIAAAVSVEDAAEGQMRETLAGFKDDTKLEEQEIATRQRMLKQKVSLLQNEASRKNASLVNDEVLRVNGMKAELAALRKAHGGAMTALQKQTKRDTARTGVAEEGDANAMNKKLKAQWAAKVARASQDGIGAIDAQEEIAKVAREAERFVNGTQLKASRIESDARQQEMQVVNETSEALEEIRSSCADRLARMKNISQNEVKSVMAVVKKVEAEIKLEEGRMESAGSNAQVHEEEEVAAARQEEAAAVKAAQAAGMSFEEQKLKAAERQQSSSVKDTDNEISKGKALKDTEKDSLRQAKAARDVAKDAAEKEADTVKQLKFELKDRTRDLAQAAYNVSYPTNLNKQLTTEAANTKESGQRHNRSVALLEEKTRSLEQDADEGSRALQKDTELNEALQNHVQLLARQVKLTEDANFQSKKELQAAVTVASDTAADAAVAEGSKLAALKLLKQKGARLKRQIQKSQAATAAAEESVALKEGTAFSQQSVDTTSALSLFESAEGLAASQEEGSQMLADRQQRCASVCYLHRGAAQPACMQHCMSQESASIKVQPQLGEADNEHEGEDQFGLLLQCAQHCMEGTTDRVACMAACRQKEEKSDVKKETLGETEATVKKKTHQTEVDRVMKIAQHCQYEEEAATLTSRRKELETLRALNTAEALAAETSLNLLQMTAKDGIKRHSTWFVQKHNKAGQRPANAYDNTSLECSCIRNCKKSDQKCISGCVWERTLGLDEEI